MSQDSSNSSTGNGNTKKQSSPVKHHLLTIKESNKVTIEYLSSSLQQFDKFMFQLEQGEETGYRHFQVYCYSEKKLRMTQVKDMLGIRDLHYEKVNNIQKCIKYCSKDETRIAGPWSKCLPIPVKVISDDILFDWQKKIVEIVQQEPDDRTIYWFWEEDGCRGKTQFCKYLTVKFGAVGPINGSKKDILYVCAKKDSNCYLVNLSRTVEGRISYDALECVKDGYYFAGKFDSDTVCRNCPHVICFANFPPYTAALSADRWKIFNIKEDF